MPAPLQGEVDPSGSAKKLRFLQQVIQLISAA